MHFHFFRFLTNNKINKLLIKRLYFQLKAQSKIIMKIIDQKHKTTSVKQLLKFQYQQSRINLKNQSIEQLIEQTRKEKQVDNFVAYTDDYSDYLTRIWKKTFVHNKQQAQEQIPQNKNSQNFQQQKRLSQQSQFQKNDGNQVKIFVPKISDLILQTASLKQQSIYQSILNGIIGISQNNKSSNKKQLQINQANHQKKLNDVQKMKNAYNNLKQQLQEVNKDLQQIKSQHNANITTSRISNTNSKNQKQYLEYVKRQKRQHEQRKKKLEQQQIAKKQKVQKQKKQEQQKIAKQKLLLAQKKHKKQKELQQIREKEKKQRQQRNSEYLKMKKQISVAPPIFLRLPQKIHQRYEQQLRQQQVKLKSQRKSMYSGLSKQKIDQHQKKIKELYEKTNEERLQRIQAIKQIQKAEVQKSRIKYHSSFSHDFTHKQYHQKVEEQREKAKEKLERIKTYKEIVKANFKPNVDEKKKKQLMNLIEQMDLSGKKVKRTVLKNGNVVYQNLNDTDPYSIGIQYLEKVKQMTTKMRKMRKPMQESHSVDISDEKKKHKNYLQELRQRSTTRTNQKEKIMASTKFSYQQKLQKVQNLAQKLMQKTKQSQMMLKFGKFKTSQQILNCKDQIDQNYLDIVNMKLQLVNRVQDL